jgi:hypothetical protein
MWEYMTCIAELQAGGGYRAEAQGKVKQGTLDAIYTEFGQEGWEMVNCYPSLWSTFPADDPAFEVTGVTAVFKRQLKPEPGRLSTSSSTRST